MRDLGYPVDYARMVGGLGERWESRNISFKPYPSGHLFHAFVDAALALHRAGLRAEEIARVTCPIAGYMVSIVCEPVAEKLRPATSWHGRVSLQFSLAEALTFGRLDAESYGPERLRDPALLDLASRIGYVIDADAPGRDQWRGWVIVETRDGRRLEEIQPYNRGSPQNPMSRDELEAKFERNALAAIGPRKAEEAIRMLRRVEEIGSVGELTRVCAR